MRDFTKYGVWKDGIDLAVKTYEITSNFPSEEKYGLINQMRRAAVSMPSNFAEGCSRSTEKDFKRFIEISIGSGFELKTQTIIASKLKFVDLEQSESFISDLDKLSKQLNTLRNKLK
ncbi:MAG: four helix bundle protein [Ekhidna sp.]|uniref:four helix bundle protein n=1 Tax=Ekhidna sp. TaxID=2608089 RepID=UPI0032ED1332